MSTQATKASAIAVLGLDRWSGRKGEQERQERQDHSNRFHLGEIESLKDTDTQKYILKLRSIRTGTEGSYKQFFNKEQLAILHQKRVDNRLSLAQNYTALKKQNLTQDEIDVKVIELELEMLENL